MQFNSRAGRSVSGWSQGERWGLSRKKEGVWVSEPRRESEREKRKKEQRKREKGGDGMS